MLTLGQFCMGLYLVLGGGLLIWSAIAEMRERRRRRKTSRQVMGGRSMSVGPVENWLWPDPFALVGHARLPASVPRRR
jgi:hypothetical protein